MKQTAPLKVLVVDKQALYYHLFQQALRNNKDILIVGLVQDNSDLLGSLEIHHPHIVLIDLDSNIIIPETLVRYITSKKLICKVLALKMHFDAFDIQELLAQGASGFLAKNDDFETFLQSVFILHQAGYFMSDKVKRMKMENLTNGSKVLEFQKIYLGRKETETLYLIYSAKNTKEIALIMKKSDRTINRYKNTLFHKTNTNSEIDLVLFALRNNLFSLPMGDSRLVSSSCHTKHTGDSVNRLVR